MDFSLNHIISFIFCFKRNRIYLRKVVLIFSPTVLKENIKSKLKKSEKYNREYEHIICWLFTNCGSTSQGLGCSHINTVRELGSEHHEIVWLDMIKMMIFSTLKFAFIFSNIFLSKAMTNFK